MVTYDNWLNDTLESIAAYKQTLNKKDAKKYRLDYLTRLAQRIAEFSNECGECQKYQSDITKLTKDLGGLIQSSKEEKKKFDRKIKEINNHLQKKHKLYLEGTLIGIGIVFGPAIGLAIGSGIGNVGAGMGCQGQLYKVRRGKMADSGGDKIEVSELYQIGIVVNDLKKSIRNYQETFGIGPWAVTTVDTSAVSDMTYHGRASHHRFKAAFAMVGPMQLELIQPLEGDNIYSDFLEGNGEGVHHLGHVRVDNIDEAIHTWEQEGFHCLQSGRFPGGGYAYMDTRKSLGVIVELLGVPEGPSPNYPSSLWKVWEKH